MLSLNARERNSTCSLARWFAVRRVLVREGARKHECGRQRARLTNTTAMPPRRAKQATALQRRRSSTRAPDISCSRRKGTLQMQATADSRQAELEVPLGSFACATIPGQQCFITLCHQPASGQGSTQTGIDKAPKNVCKVKSTTELSMHKWQKTPHE